MQDVKMYIEKLRIDKESCLSISQTATNEVKRDVFFKLSETYRKLPEDLKVIAAANVIADQERDDQLFGLLVGNDSEPTLPPAALKGPASLR